MGVVTDLVHSLGARWRAFGDRHPLSPERYSQITWIALVLLTLIVFTGAAVRLTGSGLGCPTWPKCTEQSVHSSLNTHGLIEFGNRMLTGVVSAGTILAWLGVFFVRPARPDLKYLALSLPFGVVVQATVGGLSVLFKLAPGWVMLHFALSMILVMWAFDLWWRSKRPPDEVRVVRADRSMVLLVWGLFALAALAIFLGTASTATGPHAGASGTGEFVGRLDFWGAETLRRVIRVHGLIVGLLGLTTIYAWWRSRRHGNEELTTTLMLTLALLAVQGVVGILQYELELPAEIVWVHVALASLTWVGYVHARAAVGALQGRPLPQPDGVEESRRLVGVGGQARS
jgi:cytochrome c oxidase assembly protein subunit 15